MLQKIEEATGGRVKFETYFGSTLYPPPDAWEAVKGGIAEKMKNGLNKYSPRLRKHTLHKIKRK